MDKREARQILDDFVAALQSRLTYQDWEKLIGECEVVETEGPSGVIYQMEWQAFWDSRPGGAIRVLVSIDDGRLLSAIVPVSVDSLISR